MAIRHSVFATLSVYHVNVSCYLYLNFRTKCDVLAMGQDIKRDLDKLIYKPEQLLITL